MRLHMIMKSGRHVYGQDPVRLPCSNHCVNDHTRGDLQGEERRSILRLIRSRHRPTAPPSTPSQKWASHSRPMTQS